MMINDEEKRKKYSYDKLFENNRRENIFKEENDSGFKINENVEKNLIAIKKENMLNRIKNFLKKIFYIVKNIFGKKIVFNLQEL